MLMFSASALAQNQTVTGQVLDELGEPVIGATVTVTGTKTATVTDMDGNYKSAVPKNGKVTITYPLTGTGVKESFHATAEAGGISAFTQDYYATVEKTNGTVTSPYFNADENATGIVYTVLPAIGQGTYILSLYVGGDPKSTIVPAEFMDWLPGYSYTYIFKVHVDKSVAIDDVQSAFTEWEYHYADHTVYNW